MLDKNIIRSTIKRLRNDMTDEEVTTKSKIIYDRLINLLEKTDNNTYFIYNSYNNEVSTKEIINYLLENNNLVFLPKITKKTMYTIQYNKNTKLEKNFYNILEPTGTPKDLNNFICIAPLVATDLLGHRIGQGKGYYDKYLKNKKCLKIGICYDYQIIDSIPYEKHDITLDIIISEKRIINLQNKSRN